MPDQVMPTPETQNASAEPAEQGSMEAAAQAFEKRNPEQQAQEPEAEAETQDADSDAEPAEGEPADDTEPTEELVEVVIGGKTFSVDAETAAEVQKSTLRQAEFSRKMNEASALEKGLKQKAEAAERFYEGAEKFAEAKAEARMIDAQLKQFEKVDWQSIRQANPAEYAALAADFQSLRLAKTDAETKMRSIDGEIASAKNAALAEKRDEMVKTLAKELKGWGDELGAAITKYAVDNGYSVQEIQQVTDPKWVIAMDKARRFDALQKSKVELKAKAKDAAPVLKPGAPRKSDQKADALVALRKSGSMDDAEAAFRSRMR